MAHALHHVNKSQIQLGELQCVLGGVGRGAFEFMANKASHSLSPLFDMSTCIKGKQEIRRQAGEKKEGKMGGTYYL